VSVALSGLLWSWWWSRGGVFATLTLAPWLPSERAFGADERKVIAEVGIRRFGADERKVIAEVAYQTLRR